MAGALRGRPNGSLVKITLSSGVPVLCAISDWSTASLGRCLECGYYPEDVYFLSCRHALCKQCFRSRTVYVCKVDNTTTEIKWGVEHSYVFNIGLTKITLECPRCRNPLAYKNIKRHIERLHPECFGQGQYPPLKEQVRQPHSPTFVAEDYAAGTRGRLGSLQAASASFCTRQSEIVPKKEKDEWPQEQVQLGTEGSVSFPHQSQACGRESVADHDSDMLTDDNSSDSSLGGSRQGCGIKREDHEEIVKCQHCFTPLEVSEKEEHENNCPELLVSCHECNERVEVVSYDNHMESHYEAQQRTTGAQKARDGGVGSKQDTKKCADKFKGQMAEERSYPMSTEELATYIQSLKTENTKCNESYNPQTKLLAAIDAPTQETRQEDEDDEMKEKEEVARLKNRIKELEERLERLERPLKRLIERLSQENQRKGSLQNSGYL